MTAKTASKKNDKRPVAEKKRISRPYDARAQRSRVALRDALLSLIEEREFGSITIKEITAAAGVSYPVFFRQFSSTDALLADVATEQVRQLLGYSSDAFDPRYDGRLEEMCDYVHEHRKLWRPLLTGGASPAMRDEFARISAEFRSARPRANPLLPVDLVTELVTNAIFDILTWWMRQPDDYPIGNVVKLLDALIVRVYSRPIKIELE
ncbi:TetR/AcrR family transcriptional regulator [Novosphingobium sp.]|jgi:AcrR family transcriptional regulator|uniref:TetR/AcrR family transcriptional regulator n=1 Tax=Novosphingobium sp. TaxID=1874826 RepID=UPI002FE1200D